NPKDPNWAYPSPSVPPRIPLIAWIMPYIEQTAFANQFKLDINFNSGVDATLIANQHFPTFDCPSDQVDNAGHPTTHHIQSNYGVDWGSWTCWQQGGPTKGVFPLNHGDQRAGAPFFLNSGAKIADIADGTSNTLCWSEVLKSPWNHLPAMAFVDRR